MNNFNVNRHDFTRGASINNPRAMSPLTLDQVRHFAPSAFATTAHESRSDRYVYIPTVEIITAMMREGFQPFKASQSRTRLADKRDFTKHMIRFRHPDMQVQKVGDSVPEIVLVNSHDGSSAYKLSAGLFRLVCSNGLMVADSTVASLAVHHSGNIITKVIEGSFEIVRQSTRALEVVDTWSQLALTAGEQGAFADAARELRFADAEGEINTPITAAQLLAPRRAEDANGGVTWRGSAVAAGPKPDLWHTLNVVQENVIKGGLRGVQRTKDAQTGRETRRRRVTTRTVTGIDQDVKLNRALWMLAERMAELKAAQ